MNANELADQLDSFLKEEEQLPWGTKHVYLDQASTMLRQQQAEIEALKKTISSLFGGLEASLDLNKAQALRKALQND